MKFLVQLILVVSIGAGCMLAQEIKLPSNPLKGRIVFEEKGCIKCHSISGFGGNIAPDLSREHYYGSFLELASIIWNHIPKMNRKYRELKLKRPSFSQSEMLNLIGFIYYLRYLGEPGSVSNGRKLLSDKGCIVCHDVAGSGGKKGPDFDQLQQFASPLYMVQAMWNHGPAMQEEMRELGMKYPSLNGHDIVDITSYIQQATIGNIEIRMAPGNPVNGEKVFKKKQCHNCHSIDKKGDAIGTDLNTIDLQKSVTEIAGSMWNHSPVMIDYMKSESITWPEFKGNEMSDLIAYLYFLGFEDEPGDATNGEKFFVDKGCIGCHEAEVGIGPELSKMKRFNSPIRMIQLMWNHADRMDDLLEIKNEEWPIVSTKEMQDLYAFLRNVTKQK
ncbi:MAG: c-type cytochrome [Bacteroidetes bacterium]|nr:c-type cytochrome [Bacteroidota bacterium]